MPANTPSRKVFFASGLMRSTSASPASMSTPASLYERGEGVMGWAAEPRCAWPDRICPILASARLAPVRSAPLAAFGLHGLHKHSETLRRLAGDRLVGRPRAVVAGTRAGALHRGGGIGLRA